jgi:hypothetical protein
MLSIEKRIQAAIDADNICGPEAPGNSIDQQVDENMSDLDLIYNKFQTIEGCDCPLCKALKRMEVKHGCSTHNTSR